MTKADLAPLVRTMRSLLTFRTTREELLALDRRHLALGLVCSWIVGMGRWWDDPLAHPLRSTGLGSVAYVFALSAFLWIFATPIRPPGVPRVPYVQMLTFVSLTSPPAILYAIPIERVVSLDTAATINLIFLGVVAGWRVALLVFYLHRGVGLRWYAVVVAALLPLALIVTGLTFLNLAEGVIQFMGGLRDPRDAADQLAHHIVLLLAALSYVAAIPLLLAYGTLALLRLRVPRPGGAP